MESIIIIIHKSDNFKHLLTQPGTKPAIKSISLRRVGDSKQIQFPILSLFTFRKLLLSWLPMKTEKHMLRKSNIIKPFF